MANPLPRTNLPASDNSNFLSRDSVNRREVLKRSTQLATGLSLATLVGGMSSTASAAEEPLVLNDVQSQLNATRVHRVLQPKSSQDLADTLQQSKDSGRAISVAGGRHSMGGQQFGEDNLHLDMTSFDKILDLDTERGLVTVQAGIQWPALVDGLHGMQANDPQPWTIREKQTGVDMVTIGGALSSNIHGRSLAHAPFVSDVESFTLVDASGKLRQCSRDENSELFSLVIGGYGLFGLIDSVTLRLVRRFKIRRRVKVIAVKDLLTEYQQRIGQGFVFGDCQYATAMSGPAEGHRGVFPCYEPVALETPIPAQQRQLSAEQWARFYRLMRTDKPRAFEEYAKHYLATDGQVYWSDMHQMAGNFAGHRAAVDATKGTEVISEVYLSPERLNAFLVKVRADLIQRETDITYGTIRFIEADRETFLPWAKEKSVCVICNLHVRHTKEGIAKAKADFRQIFDRVIEFEGSFFLTYHRWATAEQVAACYPRIREFFRLKRKYDPNERLQSDWYRHYAPRFA